MLVLGDQLDADAAVREFRAHAQGRKKLRMEFFYRAMRRRHHVLMDAADPAQPEGGQWNFDAVDEPARRRCSLPAC